MTNKKMIIPVVLVVAGLVVGGMASAALVVPVTTQPLNAQITAVTAERDKAVADAADAQRIMQEIAVQRDKANEQVSSVQYELDEANERVANLMAGKKAGHNLLTDGGLCAADAEMTNLELNNALAGLLEFPTKPADRTADQDDAIRAYKNAAFERACPARAS